MNRTATKGDDMHGTLFIGENEIRHTDKGEWSADASDLGLPVGVWPNVIVASDKLYVKDSAIMNGRGEDVEMVGMLYTTPGSVLKVWND